MPNNFFQKEHAVVPEIQTIFEKLRRIYLFHNIFALHLAFQFSSQVANGSDTLIDFGDITFDRTCVNKTYTYLIQEEVPAS